MRWKRTSSEALFYWSKVLGAGLAILIFIVWQRVQARQLEGQVSALQKEEAQLVYQNARMQSQINQWISPSHLEHVARKDLGMAPLDSKHRVAVQLP